MAAVAGVTVTSFVGTIQGPAPSGDVVARPGVAGTGFVRGAARPPPSTVETTLLCASLSAAVTAQGVWEALMFNSAAVIDSSGTTWTDVLIVSAEHKIFAIAGVSGRAAILVTQWQLIAET